jgi:hypothetical protein
MVAQTQDLNPRYEESFHSITDEQSRAPGEGVRPRVLHLVTVHLWTIGGVLQ